MFSLLPVKDWLYIGAIFIIICALIGWRESGVRAGEKAAQAREQKAAIAQQVKDQADAKRTTDSLTAELQSLRAIASTPPSVGVRCTTSRVPAPKPAGGTSSTPAPTSSVQPVPAGVGDGRDLGPDLHKLALACDVLSARDRAVIEWSKGL